MCSFQQLLGSSRRGAIRAAVGAAVSLAVMACGDASTSWAARCNRVASPAGSNRAAGTVRHPFATVQRLVDSLHRGEAGCLRAGLYGEDVAIRHGGARVRPIVVRSYPGERATL